MRTNRILSIAAALGAVLCLDASAGKVIPEYTNEFETEWFDAGVQSYTSGQALPDRWTKPVSTDAEVTVGDGKITLDTDLDDPLTYTPANACSNVAVVAATMTATVNASEPTFTTAPQAALAVIGTSTSTNWVGFVGNGAGGTDWVPFPSPVPVAGETYSVRIEFDQRAGEARQIRYLVGGTVLGDGWYPNPQAGTAKISNVSFSGSGDIKALSGNNVLNASFDMTDVAGFDFTNGVVSVSNVVVGGVSATAKITVIDCKTGQAVASTERQISGSDPVSWDLAADLTDNALVPGGAYTYEVDILVDGEVVAKKTDTFLAANWTDDTWFGADASKVDAEREIGGAWDQVKHPEEIVANAYVIEEDAFFNVSAEKKDEGTNTVTRVDAVVTFDAFVTALTAPEGDAFGGFVAAKIDDVAQWMALTTNGWEALTGAAAPELQTAYTVRAEVDFLSKVKRVRYFVKTGTAEQDAFVPLACGDSEWIQLAVDKDTFTSVEFQGSGTLAKFEATIADKAVAEVNGKRYDTMAEALAAAGTEGTNTIKLLTNATFEPTQAGSYDIAPNNYRYASGGQVLSNPQTIVITDPDEPPVVRPSNQVMAEVKTPGGAQYKNVNSLRDFLERNGVTAYTENKSSGEIKEALNDVPEESNGLTLWEDYVMGIEPKDPVDPVTIPTGDTADDGITLSIPAIAAATPSGDYGLLFKVVDAQNESKATTNDASAIKIPLATGTYRVKLEFTKPAGN